MPTRRLGSELGDDRRRPLAEARIGARSALSCHWQHERRLSRWLQGHRDSDYGRVRNKPGLADGGVAVNAHVTQASKQRPADSSCPESESRVTTSSNAARRSKSRYRACGPGPGAQGRIEQPHFPRRVHWTWARGWVISEPGSEFRVETHCLLRVSDLVSCESDPVVHGRNAAVSAALFLVRD